MKSFITGIVFVLCAIASVASSVMFVERNSFWWGIASVVFILLDVYYVMTLIGDKIQK